MLVLFVPFEVVVEEVRHGLLPEGPLSQGLLFRLGAQLDEAAQLDAGILGSVPRLGSEIKDFLEQGLGRSIFALVRLHACKIIARLT